jgi:hypothetical protein
MAEYADALKAFALAASVLANHRKAGTMPTAKELAAAEDARVILAAARRIFIDYRISIDYRPVVRH